MPNMATAIDAMRFDHARRGYKPLATSINSASLRASHAGTNRNWRFQNCGAEKGGAASTIGNGHADDPRLRGGNTI